VGIDGVEAQSVFIRREGQDFDPGSGPGQEMTKNLVLRFGVREVRRMVESERLPRGRFLGTIPTSMAGRADQDLAEWRGH
jgi:hypothetical protein